MVRRFYLFVFFFSFTASLPGWGESVADLLLINGKIVTVDSAFSIHRAMAIQGNRILGVGHETSLERYRGDTTTVIDLEGKTVLPGLIDSHGHPASASITEFDHPIPDMSSIADVLSYIRSRAAVLEDGEWIWVSQVFLTRLKEQRYPTREELDQAAPRNPVVFRTGPDASVNTLALEASGITDDWELDDGGPGYAEKNPSTGKITGILRSCTRYLKYTSSKSSPSREEHLSQMKKLFADYNRVGITGISERAGKPSHFALYESLHERGELTVRAVLSRHVDTIQAIEKIEAEIQNVATNTLYAGDPWLQLRTLKIFLDGGMLTGSAYMREPWGVSTLYNISDPDYRGLLFVPEEKLQAIMAACMENDVQFSAHVVGDGAVHTFIDACAVLQPRFDIRSQRPVICHSNFMSQAAVEQTAAMGICMDIQPAWLYLDGRTLFHHFGYDRLAWFQPLRALFAAGAIAGGGSDHMQKIGSTRSINLYDPWYGMWISMSRTARWLDQPLHEEHALSRVEAIRFYTINNAYIHLVESQRGSLEVGKLADFIVLDRDILTCPLDEVKEISVLKTYVDGDLVYSKTTD